MPRPLVSLVCLAALSFSLLLPVRSQAAMARMIGLSVPAPVISEALEKALPLAIDTNSSTLRGAITIIQISNLQIREQGISCRMSLQGDDMQLHTEVGGHVLKLKVGSIQLGLQCNAALRYDASKQLLYIKPVISDLKASSTAAGGDIDALLMGFLNNREFPVKMKQMQPLIAETSGKNITVNMNIAGVHTGQGVLFFDIMPQIQSSGQGLTRKK
jgi:hypothetical protein